MPEELERVQSTLRAAGLSNVEKFGERLAHYRQMYEPYAGSLAQFLRMPLPLWLPASPKKDNWQTTAWDT